jgi:phage terminase large subunit
VLQIDAVFPEPFEFLFEPHRYKGVRGGRGKGASWNIARALLILGTQREIRVLCARETQKSIADSVHALLGDQIRALDLGRFYRVTEAHIRGVNGTEFIFAGLKHNVANIKSLEGCDVVWVEEAQSVSKGSWDTLIPTVRKPGSEIWISWNDVFETDETHQRFVVHTPPGGVIKKLTWRDNPWFPEVLRVEMEHLKATDHAAYLHVWEGECISSVAGAIYAEEIAQAEKEGRIGNVPRDRGRPVETVWDLGFGDLMAIWFVQPYGGWFNFVDYISAKGKTIEWYCVQLQQRGYLYGNDWLPHDGVDAITHQKLVSFAGKSPEQVLRELGRRPRIVQKLHVATRINAGRMLFPQCRFDRDKCEEGLRALRMYQWGEPSKDGTLKREPLHNEASNGADAFQYTAIAMKQPKMEPKRDEETVHVGRWS